MVAPSGVVDEWESVFEEFNIEPETKFLSMGMLQKQPLEEATDGDQIFDYRDYTDRFSIIIADEAHNYRNDSNRRQNLENIIRQNPDSDVLLTSATPINISPEDLFSLIDLFYQSGRVQQFEKAGLKSHYETTLTELKKLDNYNNLSSSLINNIKEIENELSIKITWRIIQDEFGDDLQELAGEDVEYEEPEITEEQYDYPPRYQHEVFDEIIPFLDRLNYEPSKLWDGQGYKDFDNLIFRHKWRLYKRLESSLKAFYHSIDNLYKRFVLYYEAIRRDAAIDEGDIDSLSMSVDPRAAANATDFDRLDTVVTTYRSLDEDLQQKVLKNLRTDVDLIEQMLDRITSAFRNTSMSPLPNDEKVSRLQSIVENKLESGKPIVIFSQYQRTGRALRITNPKKVKVHNFRPADSINQELELYEKLDARLDTILDIVGLDFIVWLMDEKRVEKLHEEEREEYLANLDEYNETLASSDPNEISPDQRPPEETRTDQILRRAIKKYGLTQDDIEELSSSISRPVYTVLESSNEENKEITDSDAEVRDAVMSDFAIIGETGGESAIWTPLHRSVNSGSKDDGLSPSDKDTIEKIRSERQEQYNRERMTAGELGRAVSQLVEKVEDVMDLISDEEMAEILTTVRERLEADAYTILQRNRLEDSLSAIVSEDYGWMSNPDSEIQDSPEWQTIINLSEKSGNKSGESEVKAIIKYD